jgi:hypothetical protein
MLSIHRAKKYNSGSVLLFILSVTIIISMILIYGLKTQSLSQKKISEKVKSFELEQGVIDYFEKNKSMFLGSVATDSITEFNQIANDAHLTLEKCSWGSTSITIDSKRPSGESQSIYAQFYITGLNISNDSYVNIIKDYVIYIDPLGAINMQLISTIFVSSDGAVNPSDVSITASNNSGLKLDLVNSSGINFDTSINMVLSASKYATGFSKPTVVSLTSSGC